MLDAWRDASHPLDSLPTPTMSSKYFVRLSDVPGYHPANHHGTTNRRLISPDTVGARHMEILHGTIEKNQGALPHAHPDLEQACYVLAGRALVQVGDEPQREVVPGDAVFFPAGVPHVVTAVSDEPLQLLVIYAPPYGENPAQVVR
ncbi:hypothetical protein PATSB16_39610 [Pandoraea thiooxydans]|nr:hypothetical protein PATSB16_39610 [Pandoraea thiooxydans]